MRIPLETAALLLIVSVISGVLLAPQMSAFITPGALILAGLILALLVKIRQKTYSLPVAVCFLLIIAGLARGALWLESSLEHRLPLELDRSRATFELIVEEVEQTERGWRFLMAVKSEVEAPDDVRVRRVRLNWYPNDDERLNDLVPGAVVHAEVVLRTARRFANPLPYDYEAYMLLNGIDAIGYIRELTIIQPPSVSLSPQSLRLLLIKQVDEQFPIVVAVWLKGLVLGEGSAFTPQEWRLAGATGTLHLLVVSGLHMGMVAVIALLMAGIGWRLITAVFRWLLPRRNVVRWQKYWYLAWVLMVCGSYALVSGGGIAVCRAFLMLVGVWLLWFSTRKVNASAVFAMVVALIVLHKPLIFTQTGFQYSIVSVAVLLLAFSGRKTGFWSSLTAPQLFIFIGIIPLVLYWNSPLNVGHILANLVAIPLVTFVLLPMSLLALLLPAVTLKQWLAVIIEQAGETFWSWLQWNDGLGLPQLQATINPGFGLLWLFLVWLWLKPVSFPVNAVLALVPLMLLPVFNQSTHTKPFVIMPDVGQGLSVIASDGDKTLMFDTGPVYSAKFDAASSILIPILRSHGLEPDVVVISHSDNDHSGGDAALLASYPDSQRYYGQPDSRQQSCHQNQDWQSLSDGLHYRFLLYKLDLKNDNNQSCVVQLEWFGHRILLPGDIDAAVESQLVARYGNELKSDILVAPHHGSATSSSQLFIDVVAPQQVWFSAGFNHRYGHPHKRVRARYQNASIKIHNTADAGALMMNVAGDVLTERQGWQKPWLYH